MKKIVVIAVIFVILFSVSTVSALFYQNKYTTTLSNYNDLKGDYESLSSSYSSLQLKYDRKVNDYNSLQAQYNNLQSSYNSLQSQYSNLQSQYDELETDYYVLDENYEFYKNSIEIRYGYGSDCQGFITPKDSSVISTTKTVLGHSSDGDLSWDDMIDINSWVGSNIEYNYDTYIGEVRSCYQYPSETLDIERGDCEDHAVLMVSMCKAEGSAPWLYCAGVKFYKNGEYHYHQCVFVNIAENKLYIFDPTTKPSWFSGVWHSSSSKSEESALDEYRNKLGASSITVTKIFNENTYHYFSNNQEFYDYF